MDEKDLTVARLVERQILKEKHPLGCGCVLESKYGHPVVRDWLLVHAYIEACSAHRKIADHLGAEKETIPWGSGSFIPMWRDGDGLWVLRNEWRQSLMTANVPLDLRGRALAPINEYLLPGVFEDKEKLYLLLVGYLGTPVVLGEKHPQKVRGRAICLDLNMGNTAPKPVPEAMLLRFGWKKEE